jgi:hypothetical protein
MEEAELADAQTEQRAAQMRQIMAMQPEQRVVWMRQMQPEQRVALMRQMQPGQRVALMRQIMAMQPMMDPPIAYYTEALYSLAIAVGLAYGAFAAASKGDAGYYVISFFLGIVSVAFVSVAMEALRNARLSSTELKELRELQDWAVEVASEPTVPVAEDPVRAEDLSAVLETAAAPVVPELPESDSSSEDEGLSVTAFLRF